MKKTIYEITGTLFTVAIVLIFFITAGCAGQTEKVAEEANKPVTDISEDMGAKPWVLDIEAATVDNNNYRTAVWSGKYMQLVLMSLKPGEKINLEMHPGHDQFFRIDQGKARILMGLDEENLTFDKEVEDDWAMLVPDGYWHQIINIGDVDLKLYTIYGPPEHAPGTTHKTYKEAEEAGHDHDHDGHEHGHEHDGHEHGHEHDEHEHGHEHDDHDGHEHGHEH